MSTSFMRVDDVANELSVSKPYAYKLIQKLNEELKRNDIIVREKLSELGYRVCVVWECVTRDKNHFPHAMERLKTWLVSNDDFLELSI